jgi:hypothetical protein
VYFHSSGRHVGEDLFISSRAGTSELSFAKMIIVSSGVLIRRRNIEGCRADSGG